MTRERIILSLGSVCISSTKCRRIPHNWNHRLHYQERARWNLQWYELVKAALMPRLAAAKWPTLPLKDPEVTYTFHQIREMDWDNLMSSTKVLTDALKINRIIKNDSPKDLPQPKIRQEKVGHKADEHVTIEVAYTPIQ